MLTAAQVAVKLKVSKRRVLALIEAGRLPAKKIGVQYLIRPEDVSCVAVRRTGRPRKAAGAK